LLLRNGPSMTWFWWVDSMILVLILESVIGQFGRASWLLDAVTDAIEVKGGGRSGPREDCGEAWRGR
ncbi:hypothetical protein, partial [Streptosporangium sp. NPDC003464]